LQKGDLAVICAYVVAQLSGCTLGCIGSKLFYGQGGPIYVVFPDGLDLMKDCIEEFVGTFLLLIFIFILTNEETTFVHSEAWGHLLIGLIYYFCLT
jgi:glycerol uptake facilitator-like aquaporin